MGGSFILERRQRALPRRQFEHHETALPPLFARWFDARGWTIRRHQIELLRLVRASENILLIAPTGAGKTLAGFLPSLVDLTSASHGPRIRRAALHTLYISPLKALAVDVERNLEAPVRDLELPVRVETRTGDTPGSKRYRQRRYPPDILLTTPEQLALLLSGADARLLFQDLRRVILDELHALIASKRGDLLALGLARLRTIAPNMRTTGLSATVRDPDLLRRYLTSGPPARLIGAEAGAPLHLSILDSREFLPWAGHGARYAVGEIYARIQAARLSLVFVNTRSQAELLFQELWRINDEALAIALHHGSLDAGQRRRVEQAMAEGRLRAVVCTSTLDLGIDWGDVDQVINVGAPKGASRLIQRIGRANHRLDEPSLGLLVPANRFEVLECRAAVDAAAAGIQDAPVAHVGALDVLAQHIVGMACAAPFDATELYREVVSAAPYERLSRNDFDATLDFVATGGYALKSYERFARIRPTLGGHWRIANPRAVQLYRLNIGTIVEEAMLKIRLVRGRAFGDGKARPYTGPLSRRGRVLGEIEEYFIEMLAPGDTFMFGGEILAFEGLSENEALVSRSAGLTPKVPSYMGGRFPLSTHLAQGVRQILSSPGQWRDLPEQVADWLTLQSERSNLPQTNTLLVETFPRAGRHYLVTYPFEGRLAHQTLGMLLTRRLERAGLKPMGFVASDYALAIWLLADIGTLAATARVSLAELFSQDMLGDDLESWLHESSLMKRTFRNCAIIAGLVERRFPGKEKTHRQMTVSTDLIYDVLRGHQPDHVLLRAARADAASGLLDLSRLAEMLARIEGKIDHKDLPRVSPLAVPIMLEIGRETIFGEAQEMILAEAAQSLLNEAQFS
jgi:ATP-dependent helicase Lhr and Lhr-like helicase